MQVGYGRLGDYFWGFDQQDVVPDIVTMAKCTGNGIPVGAVVTTREIADRLLDEGSFFSSMGGSPVGCAAAMATLDALEAEGLQENAVRIGARITPHHIAGRIMLDLHAGLAHPVGDALMGGAVFGREKGSLQEVGAFADAAA